MLRNFHGGLKIIYLGAGGFDISSEGIEIFFRKGLGYFGKGLDV